jgi:hypothetical protein
MSNNATQSDVDWSSLAQGLIRSLSQSNTASDAELGTQITETCAAAFASGFSRGRWGKVEVGGVPVDLAAGVLLHLVALSGLARSQARDLHNLAEGALATYFATWGATVGKRARQGESILPSASALLRSAQGTSEPGANGSLPPKDAELLEFIRTIVPN